VSNETPGDRPRAEESRIAVGGFTIERAAEDREAAADLPTNEREPVRKRTNCKRGGGRQ
jgi:hypothetical protein